MKDLRIAIILLGIAGLILAGVIYFNARDIAKNEKKIEIIESRLDSLEIDTASAEYQLQNTEIRSGAIENQ